MGAQPRALILTDRSAGLPVLNGSMGSTYRPAANRLMWITADRVFYVGWMGCPTERTIGAYSVYLGSDSLIEICIAGGPWVRTEVAVVPPYVQHRVLAPARLVNVLHIEAESVEDQGLPQWLQVAGPVHASDLADRVRFARDEVRARGRGMDLERSMFDGFFFGSALPARRLDPRIRQIVEGIKAAPHSAPCAGDCAKAVGLSFSRFLHLFRRDVGAPFRNFRSWKRARSILHYRDRSAKLVHVALESGYPDASHFSHAIRHVYGLMPKEILSALRKLEIYA